MERPIQTPPNEPQAQLRWLVDRAQISDLLVEYARCADAADWSGMGELFTEDGQAVFGARSFPGRSFGDAAGAVMARFYGTTTCRRITRSKSTVIERTPAPTCRQSTSQIRATTPS